MSTTSEQQQPTVEDSATPNHDTVTVRPNDNGAGIRVSERKMDPTREALQKAAMIDHQRRLEPGQWVPLGNGESVRVQGNIGMMYPGEDAGAMLARPQDMLIDPKPDFVSGPRYQWRVRTSADPKDDRPAETANRHRSNRIRYVETKEVDQNSQIAVYTEYATANNCYVTYRSLILCEILDEKLAYQTYKGWEDLGLSRVMHLEEEVLSHPDVRIPNKTTGKIDMFDTRRGG